MNLRDSSADFADDDCGMAYLLNKSATGALVATVSDRRKIRTDGAARRPYLF
jgi:hypothetical protein